MKLYGSTNDKSFNTLKLRALLAEVGADYELAPVDLAKGEHKSAEFLSLNPHGKIPVLIDDEFVLPESDAILWYLGEKLAAGKLLPASDGSPRAIRERARILQWCDFASTTLYPAYSEWWNAGNGPEEKRQPAVADAALAKLTRAFGVTEAVLCTREWIAGPTYSLADVSNAAMVFAIKRRLPSDPLAKLERTQEWYERVIARPAWKTVLA
jgi:glutathione S-transferase